MSKDDSLQQRELYGGAMSIALPQRFVDISDFRPIPDHQEVRELRRSPGALVDTTSLRRRRSTRATRRPTNKNAVRVGRPCCRCFPMPAWTSRSWWR